MCAPKRLTLLEPSTLPRAFESSCHFITFQCSSHRRNSLPVMKRQRNRVLGLGAITHYAFNNISRCNTACDGHTTARRLKTLRLWRRHVFVSPVKGKFVALNLSKWLTQQFYTNSNIVIAIEVCRYNYYCAGHVFKVTGDIGDREGLLV